MLLNHYSGEQDIVFGAAFSGRLAELEGIETMIGPCVNNIPVRVSVGPDQEVLTWLKEMQQAHFELSQHQYSSLMQVQGWSQVPLRHRLFESLLVFQNYVVDDAARRIGSSVEVRNLAGPDRTNYPITIMVVPGPELSLKIIYDRERFDASVPTRILHDLKAVLESLPAALSSCIQDVLKSVPPLPALRVSRPAKTQAVIRTTAAYVAPGTEMERAVAAIWQEAFQTEKVGIHDNFFELGGHSLLMVQVHGKLEAALKRCLPIARMFQYPTISSLARHLSDDQSDASGAQKIRDRARQQREALARQRQLTKR
jgi:non-ribosomal peptide synthetase component F